ncbi:helix-turn-helix transcriptional regulator [Streptomyces longwoodensis]|uniref:helix-turn-helix domain-containing protein n=1 Tax=Streptomyces longwoodensis TaxID=68231 RepID=UPI0033E9B1AC
MEVSNALGEFLRARRALVRPEDVGLRGGGIRRVPGLRREEVALLAGISADYYLRLEQGRDRNPSAQVLRSVARVLRLDAGATAHLLAPARPPGAPRTAAPQEPDAVPASVRGLIDGWTRNPAYVQNRYADALAVNRLATALSPNYAPGVNLLRAVFLDPAERALRRDWEELTEEGVAVLRGAVGPDLDGPRLGELVAGLSAASERFRKLWERHDVQPRRGRISRLRHPEVGDLDLYSNKLSIEGADGLTLVVFHAEPGSPSEERLEALGASAAAP